MDFHKFENITVEAAKTAHTADEGVQDKYGVKHHQFWVNEEEGTVFCLIEGPDKETCAKVHQISHGNVACALTEVEPGIYEKLMGKDFKLDHGHVQHINGTVDPGYRNILVVSVYGITTAKKVQDISLLLTPHWARKLIIEKFSMFSGREIKWDIDDSLIAIFDDSTEAVRCALQIQKEIIESEIKNPAIVFKIGISAAQPVTKEGDFFTEAIRLAHRLSNIASNNQVLISALVKKLCKEYLLLNNNHLVKSLTQAEEEFLSKLLNTSEAKLAGQDFDLNHLSSDICISRPQLYRKITALTGRSPHAFILDLRLEKALALLKQSKMNIAEIAYQTGFNSPSYFTKCFSEKFGCTPSRLTKAV
jgi:AraC-like DNA-binding protein